MSRPLLISLLFAGASAASAQNATEPVVQLDPLQVIAHPTGADERAASVWVVRADPAAPAPLAVAGWLAGVPGVQIDQPGGPGGRSTLYLRGAEENHGLVFLDGIPLNDPTNSRGGSVDLSLLEPALLERAAVVRGAASVRHGPEALAGTVHFETAAATGDRTALSAEAGGRGLLRGSLAVDRAFGAGAQFGVAASGYREGSLAGGSRAGRRFVRAAVATTGAVRVRAAVWHLRHEADNFPDDSGGRRLAVARDLEHRDDRQTAGSVKFEGALAGGTWSVAADAAQFDATVTTPAVAPGDRDPMGLPAMTDDTRFRRFRINATLERTTGAWQFAGGLDAQREEGRDTGRLDYGFFQMPTSFALDRSRAGAFAEATGTFAPVTVVAGARVDRYDDGLTRGTVRAGLLGRFAPQTTWRVNAGTGFKPASFYALANPLVGNPDLKPERVRTLDAGLRQTFARDRGLLDLAVFTSRSRDGIDFDPGPPPRLVNRSGIRSEGAEATLAWKASDTVSLSGALGYVDARSQPGDERLRSRPRWRSALAVAWTPEASVTFRAALTAVGDSPDTSIPTGDVLLGGWARVDLAFLWRATKNLTATVALDNALDRDYEEAVGFPSPGRRLRLGLRAEF